MIGERDMAVFAGIVKAAALHFDCDNVHRLAVVGATSLRINTDSTNFWDSTDFWKVPGHGGNGISRWSATPRRSHRTAESGRQSGSPKSSVGFVLNHPAHAFDGDYPDVHKA